jgi:hypothetical protein
MQEIVERYNKRDANDILRSEVYEEIGYSGDTAPPFRVTGGQHGPEYPIHIVSFQVRKYVGSKGLLHP